MRQLGLGISYQSVFVGPAILLGPTILLAGGVEVPKKEAIDPEYANPLFAVAM